MIIVGHRLSCSRFKGEAFCSCGAVDAAELIDWFVDRATDKVQRRAA